jgi:8-oxo-dGTP diphosphatase
VRLCDEYDPNYVPQKNYFLIGVKLILTNIQGEVLVLKRSDKSSSPHSWDFPGGGVDSHESPALAAIRELHEETGISITDVQLFTSEYVLEKDEDALILGFSGTTNDTTITLSWEHESYEWVSKDKLLKLGLRDLHSLLIRSYLNKK